MPADTTALRELFAASIEELTQEEYDEDQRAAWASRAADAQAFGKVLAGMLTLVVQVDGEYAGFASLKDSRHVEMLYVHPYHAGEGIGSALMDALEKIAAARGTAEMTVDASDTAQPFFEDRGYVATRRNSVPVDDEWLSNTTMSKKLDKPSKGSA
jgi:putative acetyltransferase